MLARGAVCLYTPPFLGPKFLAAKSPVSITCNLTQNKRFNPLLSPFFPALTKNPGGGGVTPPPTNLFSCSAWPLRPLRLCVWPSFFGTRNTTHESCVPKSRRCPLFSKPLPHLPPLFGALPAAVGRPMHPSAKLVVSETHTGNHRHD